MNKPVLFNVSGGGNVVGYNYVDNAWAEGTWQEMPIDCHCAFPHMELMEGNWAPKMGASTTHGNAGYLMYFPQLLVQPVCLTCLRRWSRHGGHRQRRGPRLPG